MKVDKRKNVDKRKKKSAGTPRVICYASNFGIDLLRDSDCWSGDGTFSVCLEPCFQFYTVHAHVGLNSYPPPTSLCPARRGRTIT
jgi:hypothetical protein